MLDNLKYIYDECGNISEIRENGDVAARYTYDKLNRLVCEDNLQLNITTWFNYDNNGNILSKRVRSSDSDVKTLYGYDGDKLLLFGDETFKYDTLGNPTTYRGKEATWERGRLLKKYNGVEFTYDGQGRRISKGATLFTYDCSGNLIKQTDGISTLEFIYDHGGVMGFEYTANNDTKTYFYRRNAQGDIIALLDNSGKVVVKYVYDAWGNHEVKVLDSNCTELSQLNPFRYRGYYYDTETKLYYLKTRYYDPEVGRFITIDDLSYLDPEHINGLNLYAYCGNNPVMNVDSEGTSWWKKFKRWVKKAAGWVVTVAVAVAGVALIVGTAIGMVVGTIATGGILGAVLIGIGVGILAGMSASIISQGGFGNLTKMNPWNIVVAGLIGGAIGGLSAGFSYSFATFGEIYGGVIGNMLSHLPVLSTIATESLASMFTFVGGLIGRFIGGYIGGAVTNFFGDDVMNKVLGHDADNPNWLRSLLRIFFGKIKG